MRVGTARVNGGDFGARRPLRVPFVLRWMVPRSRDSIAGLIAVVGGIAILINALFMQSGPHPAPIFANKPAPLVVPSFGPVVAMLPKGDKTATAAPARPRGELVTDIQRELTKRGFYEGAADGVYGPKTDAAIRDFEQAAGLRASAEPSEALLAAIAKSSVKAAPVPAGARKDPIAELLGPNKRLIAIQRALADFGYGPVQATGVHDAPTRSAIERFERARKRPVTGNVNEQLARDLAAMTGRPLEW